MINLKGISVKYKDNYILKNFDLSISSGVYKVSGENGCGKSTLCNLIAGDNLNYSGEYKLFGKEFKEYSSAEIYSNIIAYARQESELIEGLTVLENMELNGIDLLDPEFNALMDTFDMNIYRDTKIKNLSGGEKKKIQLIRVFSSQCPIIILDEPDNHLDSSAIEELEKLIEKSEKLIIYVSHNITTTNTVEINLEDGYTQAEKIKKDEIGNKKVNAKRGVKVKFNLPIKILTICITVFSLFLIYILSMTHGFITNAFTGVTSEFENPNSIIVMPPISSTYRTLYQTEDWYKKTPFYLTENFVDELSKQEGVKSVIPIPNQDFSSFTVYDDKNNPYMLEDGNTYQMKANYKVVSNITNGLIKGRYPHDDAGEIALNKNYAKMNNKTIGDSIVLDAKSPDGEKAEFTFKVVGILEEDDDQGTVNLISLYSNGLKDDSINNNLEEEKKYVTKNSIENDLSDIDGSDTYYYGLYVELEDEQSVKNLAKNIYKYDPYIEVMSNVDTGVNFLKVYIDEKVKIIEMKFIIVATLIMFILLILDWLNIIVYNRNLKLKLIQAGLPNKQINKIFVQNMRKTNIIMLVIYALSILMELIFKANNLVIIQLIITVIYLVLRIFIRKMTLKYKG